jgi:hypothetical protein
LSRLSALLYPTIRLRLIPRMLGIACLGALIAALYGIIHDQVTYTISPEYFTRLKFRQFHYADFGLPLRVFVAEIGALATWWVGFAAGWFMARIVVPRRLHSSPMPYVIRGFLIMIGCTVLAGVIGFSYGATREITPANSGLADLADARGVRDIAAFVRVAYIHNAGYLGGLIGLVLALILLKRRLRDREAAEGPPSLPRPAEHAKE